MRFSRSSCERAAILSEGLTVTTREPFAARMSDTFTTQLLYSEDLRHSSTNLQIVATHRALHQYAMCNTSRMAKKITRETLAAQLSKMDARIERGFGAVAEDISKLATKDQIIALHTQ